MDLLNNAVESIQVAIEDYDVGTPARLRSCVRSIHAGILLLFKERLRQLSPAGSNELLIKAKFKPQKREDGTVVLVGDGRKTVDLQQIEERFGSLGVTADWKRFKAITNIRNEIEHYYTTVTQKALHSLIADAFVVIRSFVRSELGDDPRNLLGDGAWQRMLDVSAVYDQERAECDALLAKVAWGSGTLEQGIRSVSCSGCGSTLLRPVDASIDVQSLVLVCTACGETAGAEEFVPSAVESELGFAAHIAIKDGGDEPYTTCPNCGEETYVLEGEMRCVKRRIMNARVAAAIFRPLSWVALCAHIAIT